MHIHSDNCLFCKILTATKPNNLIIKLDKNGEVSKISEKSLINIMGVENIEHEDGEPYGPELFVEFDYSDVDPENLKEIFNEKYFKEYFENFDEFSDSSISSVDWGEGPGRIHPRHVEVSGKVRTKNLKINGKDKKISATLYWVIG